MASAAIFSPASTGARKRSFCSGVPACMIGGLAMPWLIRLADEAAGAGTRQFLGQYHAVERIRHLDAAVSFGKADAQHAGLGRLAVQFARSSPAASH